MIHDTKWRLGILIGVLVLLWTFILPFLGQVGIIPLRLSPANIGAGFLFIGPFLLTEFLMVLFVFFGFTRPFSFGLAVPLLVFQIILIVRTFYLGFSLAFFFNLPGCMALSVVGIAFYLTRVRHSREQRNTLEPFNKQER